MTPTSARSTSPTKKERFAQEIAKAVGAGRPVAVETVDFNDPNRPKTCLEVDFPIVPINEIAAIEGKGSGALKPVYQTMKWWARRRSTVFRAMLIGAVTKSPDDPIQAARTVWDLFYANHQLKQSFKNIRVADVFMGGGTTIVEGERLGLEMYGCDINPVAWLVVRNEISAVDPDEIKRLLALVESEVKPQIQPFFACVCPRGHKGEWSLRSDVTAINTQLDPLTLSLDERMQYDYSGPELAYIFWAKHGTCRRGECGHRTPIFSSPLVAVKTLTIKAWIDVQCTRCQRLFDVEVQDARLAPGVPLVIGEAEKPYTVLRSGTSVVCPCCGYADTYPSLGGKQKEKRIDLSIVVHPSWLAGIPRERDNDTPYGGSAGDSASSTAAWLEDRAKNIALIEFRGELPETIHCPDTGEAFSTTSGTVHKRSTFTCGSCGLEQELVESTAQTGKTGPVAPYVVQGYCPVCDAKNLPNSGRFFAPADDWRQTAAAEREWETRRDRDLSSFWPTCEIPYGHRTHERDPIDKHGYTHFWKMFNPRQLLVHSQLLKAIVSNGSSFSREATDRVLGCFQQYLRNQNMFAFWNMQRALEPHFSNNNYHPKTLTVENCVFSELGRGSWTSCAASLAESISWLHAPWEIVSAGKMRELLGSGVVIPPINSEKVVIGDSVRGLSALECRPATDLVNTEAQSIDLVITDPPFGDNIQYAELADFFYVWLRLALKDHYSIFQAEYCPKTLEAVSNRTRHKEDPDGFYKRVLTDCWRECERVLKPGGLLAFTFHHSEEEPWVAVLESLFEAGFYIEATYPIRGDETKGEGQFGSQKIEYDIIHVCRKRVSETAPVSWARMRREVLREVRTMADILELHHKAGLPAGDLQVMKRGKALEYYSRHYGKVYVDEDTMFSVREALIGINQLLDEETSGGKEPPPVNAEPLTRQFLRLFDGVAQQPRDQIQKLLRGTTIDPREYEERGWCTETQKVYHLKSPLEIAQRLRGQRRSRLTGDYDQAMLLIGASFPGSGINVADTLSNPNFRPHPALARLLKWHTTHGAAPAIRNAAAIAVQLYAAWENQHQDVVRQLKLFFDDGEVA